MRDLAALPTGTRVFVDTNVLYLSFYNKSVTCNVFFARLANHEVEAYVNTEVLSDLLHKLMLAEAYARGIITKRRASLLKAHLLQNRTCLAAMPDHQSQFENTLAMGLNVLPITKKLLIDTKTERATFGLMTNDSLHLGNMKHSRTTLKDIATYDGDFDHIPGLTVWAPQDVIP